MSDYLDEFLLFHSVFYRFAEMKSQLVGGDSTQSMRHSNEAAITR
jgi:hypothetical protein